MLEKLRSRWETVVHELTVNPKDGTAAGLAETIVYMPPAFGGKPVLRVVRSCICLDIYRRQVMWLDVNRMDELLPKNNVAKSLSRRLRTELNKFVAEGKIDGKSIKCLEHRKPVAGQQ